MISELHPLVSVQGWKLYVKVFIQCLLSHFLTEKCYTGIYSHSKESDHNFFWHEEGLTMIIVSPASHFCNVF